MTITYTSTARFAGVDLRDTPAQATHLWRDLVDPWNGAGLAHEIAAAVRELVGGDTWTEARDRLADLDGVGDALGGALPDVLLSLAGDVDDRPFWRALATLPALGQGHPLGFETDLDDVHAALAPLAAVDRDPTVVIRFPDEFRDVDVRTRRSWCRLVAALSTAADVHLVCSGLERAWLADRHRADLPGVSEGRNTHRDTGDRAAALDLVDVGSRHARILRLLAGEDTETASFHRVYAALDADDVSRGRIRQVIGDLANVGLVDAFGTSRDRRVELTAFGRQFFNEEIAIQRRLDGRVSDDGKLYSNSRVSPREHGDAPNGDTAAAGGTRHRLPSYHEIRYVNRRTAAAAAGTATEPGITFVNHPIEPQDDRAEGRWHAEDDRLVVSAEGDNPMQMWVTLALALADWRTFDRLLTRRRLDDHDVLDMLRDGKSVLRGMRNIGWLPDDLADDLPDDVTEYDALRDAFLDEACDLADRTGDLAGVDGDDERALRSEITKKAHGLAGSLTQLLDLADVDLVRVVKFPDFSRRFDADDAGGLWESIAHGSAIGSTYGHHVPQRLLFEDRQSKRRQAFDPVIDATDPFARLIGSWCLVGDFAGKTDAAAAALREEFDDREPHDDAPEIALRTEIRTEPTRRQVAETSRRMLASKGLKPTPEAVSVLHGLARTQFDVADALNRLAGGNDDRRIDAAEVRFALAQLPHGRLLRGFDGRRTTPRRLVSALLAADRPLSPTELDDVADVSARSRRDHLADLEAVGLVETDDAGRVRLRLSFRDVDGERYGDRYPRYVDGDPAERPTTHAAAKVLRVGREHHGPGGPVAEPGWPFGGAVDPPDPRRLRHPRPYLDAILPALWGVRARDEYRHDPDVAPPTPTRTAEAGPRIDQVPLDSASDGDSADPDPTPNPATAP